MMERAGEFMWSEGSDDRATGSRLVAWDGRLDNGGDLAWRLAKPLSATTCDAALALAAYQRSGIAGLRDIVGDWSAVIHDAPARAVVLASDYAGVRPLYYHARPGKVFWSTRLEALVAATGISALDEGYIGGFLTTGGCANRTPYAGIFSVPAGHAVSVTATEVTVRSFWTPPAGDSIRYHDERRYDEEVRALFRDAVTVRLQTDGPVVAELSGGLDSSSVVCMANHLIRTGAVPAPRLTTVSYVHRESTDVPFMREVETFCGIDGVHLSTHEHPLVSEAHVGTARPEAWVPLHESAAMVARRSGAKVFLTGQSGDLVMGNWFDDSVQVAASLRRGRIGETCAQALAWSKVLRVPMTWILWQAVRTMLGAGGEPRALCAGEGVSSPARAEISIDERFWKRMGRGDAHDAWSRDWMLAPPERRKHFQALARMRDLRTLQLPSALRGLDYTHPFAHRPLVEFLMSMPADVLCRPGQPRRLMRRALGPSWPPKLQARRSKSLFGAPWNEALRPLALRLLNARVLHVVERGWIDRPGLVSRLERLTQGLACNEPQLRQIILLEHWLRCTAREAQPEGVLRTA
ncbi:MAG: asparagine synthase-related protein [Vicinamibacterales bacterium]